MSEYTLADFEEDMDEIFHAVPEGPRLVGCGRCGDVVLAGEEDCSCGYIGTVIEHIKKRLAGRDLVHE